MATNETPEEEVQYNEPDEGRAPESRVGATDAFKTTVVTYIGQQANLPVHVGDVAKCAGVSRRALEGRFLEHLQRSPAA